MLFSSSSIKNALTLVIVTMLTACGMQPVKQETAPNDVVADIVTDYSDYASKGLLTVDTDYRKQYQAALQALKKKQHKTANQILGQLIEQRPDLVSAIYNKALLEQALGNEVAAIEWLQQAHKVDPANENVCNALGRSMRLSGKFNEAEKVYTVCLSFEDQSPIVHKNYGILLDLYLHKPALALKQYQTYMDNTDGSDRQVKGWLLDLQRRVTSASGGNN
ncbi:hypothetical protein ACFOEK_08745 [Litoribrevibacter euphylliae]|uniref:Tetratricopeptide repeat protein n=1 Tax=Litoribrevibacter euphylliae TaxID=1834034 RepID=A0ABV7HB15_9GAMM